jgi:hypothetical protein
MTNPTRTRGIQTTHACIQVAASDARPSLGAHNAARYETIDESCVANVAAHEIYFPSVASGRSSSQPWLSTELYVNRWRRGGACAGKSVCGTHSNPVTNNRRDPLPPASEVSGIRGATAYSSSRVVPLVLRLMLLRIRRSI